MNDLLTPVKEEAADLPGNISLEAVVDDDPVSVILLDAHLFQTQILRVWPPADTHEQDITIQLSVR